MDFLNGLSVDILLQFIQDICIRNVFEDNIWDIYLQEDISLPSFMNS